MEYHVKVKVNDEENCFEVEGSCGFVEQADTVFDVWHLIRQFAMVTSVTFSGRAMKQVVSEGYEAGH